jgi:glycosyltransferase involved in cell wall biosynthesis
MKLIYLIAGTYRPAGMERVLANKANWFAGQGADVLIVTTDQRGRESAFAMDPRIRTVDLGIGYEDNNGGSFVSKLLLYPFKQLKHRRRLTALLKREKADVVVSMFCNDASFVPGIKDGSHKVLEIHFSRYKRLQYGRKGLWALADKWRSANDARVAARFERFVVLTDEDAGYWGKMPNIRVIPNARTFTFDTPSSLENRQVLAVGRYSYQKAFDRLVAAWKMIDTEGWTLRIAGAGDALPELPDNVKTGLSEDMKQEYLDSSIFALSSRYEGLPMVLLEAQAAGLPIVSFTCKCGPRDVVTDGVDGILVEEGDVRGLAKALKRLMDDRELRRKMGEAAYKASDRFDEEKIMRQWLQLFEELCGR